MPGTLSPEDVFPLLRGRFGRPYRYAERCQSTQRLLDEDLPEGAVAVCEEQTAGRGRLGRGWETPPRTAILCSILLRPPPGRRAPELSLVGGLATADAVAAAVARPVRIKWPNDVLVDGSKVAGILAEARAGTVVLGIGLNVLQEEADLPADARTQAASLRSIDGLERRRAALLADLLLALERRYDSWLSRGLPALLDDLRRLDALLGRDVELDGVRGTAAGIDDSGNLLIVAAGATRAFAAGDVSIESAEGIL